MKNSHGKFLAAMAGMYASSPTVGKDHVPAQAGGGALYKPDKEKRNLKSRKRRKLARLQAKRLRRRKK